MSIVEFSVNFGFQLASVLCSFQLFQFRTVSLQRQQIIPQNEYHRKVRLVLVRRRQIVKVSSRRPFWLSVSKNRKTLPKACQTGFLLGITESLVGIPVPYRSAFATLYDKLKSQL